jgi:hypothetical protein
MLLENCEYTTSRSASFENGKGACAKSLQGWRSQGYDGRAESGPGRLFLIKPPNIKPPLIVIPSRRHPLWRREDASMNLVFLQTAHVGTAALGCPAEQSSAVGTAAQIVWRGHSCPRRLGAALPAEASWTVVYGAGIFVCGIVCSFLRLVSAYRFAAITLSIVLLIAHQRPPWIVASHRFVEVSLGIVLSLLAAEVWRVPGTKAV